MKLWTYHLHEFLFHTEIMVGDGENGNSVFELLCDLHAFLRMLRIALVFLLCLIGQEMHQQSCLHNHNGLVGMVHGNVVPVKLR